MYTILITVSGGFLGVSGQVFKTNVFLIHTTIE